jgi:hypothetical protein
MRLGLALLLAISTLMWPAAASAHHLVASATVDGKLGPVNKYGQRELTLTWNVTCGDPDATAEIHVGRLILPKNPRLAPIADTFEAEAVQGPGSAQTKVNSGSRFRPVVELECSKSDEDGTSHLATTTATGTEHYTPPRLLNYSFSRSSLCGFKPTKRNMRKMQVGQGRDLEPVTSFNSHSLLNRPRSTRGIVLRLRGAGMNARVRGRARQNIFAFTLPIPKRAGRAKLWLEFDGTATNKLTIPILSKRC